MNGRPWNADDTATLKRMAGAGYSDGEIAKHLLRDKSAVTRKRNALHVSPGVSPTMIAILARINLRRRMAA